MSKERELTDKEILTIKRGLLTLLHLNITSIERITAQNFLDELDLSKNVKIVLRRDNSEGCQSEKKPFKEHEYNRFCDCLMCKETKQEG